MVDTLSRFTIRGNQETTHKSTDKNAIISEKNDTDELSEGISL